MGSRKGAEKKGEARRVFGLRAQVDTVDTLSTSSNRSELKELLGFPRLFVKLFTRGEQKSSACARVSAARTAGVRDRQLQRAAANLTGGGRVGKPGGA
jgi:hypothetical protein